ncbi:hypothetical protein [Microbulbifer yueqingensis]|uniref:Inhibitor of g-type lysozyme n=1 Tax=Microbulbifer yueqingensis TaxID=658219 RepID=A0A1G8UMJ8_9GAMM|nr:hypothetical protein [Microbulbifer yueqingensis]SDJ54981.1 hypothetical protein SAMN05216212_0193 [Microbulbifer yueqingensis]
MSYLSRQAANSKIRSASPASVLASLLAAVLLLAAAPLARAAEGDDADAREIQFKPGHSGASVEGTIKGRDSIVYTVRAKSGQRMIVEMQTDNATSYFNIYPPGNGPGDTAMFIGSVKGNRFSGVLAESGIYTIQVYLMRSAARRDETANFSLEVSISAATPASTGGRELAWPEEYDATGDLPCSTGEPGFNRACPFRVKRELPDATIWTTSPATPAGLRVLYFRRGRFSSDDAAEVRWERQGDNWRVAIGEREFYLVPDAVIQGG